MPFSVVGEAMVSFFSRNCVEGTRGKMIDVYGAAVNTDPKDLSGAEPSLSVSRDAVSQEILKWRYQDPRALLLECDAQRESNLSHATCNG